MTESEWLTCADPTPMLEFLKGKASDRKLRLFAVACAGTSGHSTSHFAGHTDIVERFVDGQATEDELRQVVDPWDFRGHEDNGWFRLSLPNSFQTNSAAEIACDVAASAGYSETTYNAFSSARNKMRTVLASILRCIIGNPFRPVTLEPSWLTTTVVKLTQAIYDDRAFDHLPSLADALEETGCTNTDVLNHCRDPGPHVKGCWVVDLVLGKE